MSHDANVAAQVPGVGFDALAVLLVRPWFSRSWMYVSRYNTNIRTRRLTSPSI